jgi:hypothetical protein
MSRAFSRTSSWVAVRVPASYGIACRQAFVNTWCSVSVTATDAVRLALTPKSGANRFSMMWWAWRRRRVRRRHYRLWRLLRRQGLHHQVVRTDRDHTPPSPAANRARLFLKDNGLGKTQLGVKFANGTVRVLATEG